MGLTRWRQDVTQYLTLAQVRAAACAPLRCVFDVSIVECSTKKSLTLLLAGRQLCSNSKLWQHLAAGLRNCLRSPDGFGS